jgi:hypothetical protein
VKARAKHAGQFAMKKYWMFAAAGYVVLLAALGFALDLGIVAMMLRTLGTHTDLPFDLRPL